LLDSFQSFFDYGVAESRQRGKNQQKVSAKST